jgi:ATP-dependent DNA helicase RecQ
VILHDKTLHELCRVRPQTLQALSAVHGIGGSKLNLYGDGLLEVIADYPRDDSLDNNLSNTVNTTLSAFLSGESIELIAEQREIKTQTVYQHLSQAIEAGLLELSEVIKLDDDQLGDITSAIELCRLEDEFSMKQVYQSLDGRFEYPILYCVQASLPQ